MQRNLFFIFLFSFLYICNSKWYISPKGDDIKGNGTLQNPFKTFLKAYKSITSSGEVINALEGVYYENLPNINKGL
jgi:hypothetical protein